MSHSFIVGMDDVIVITGASGFIGAKVVETLLAYGFSNLRCCVRHSSNLHRLNSIVQTASPRANITLLPGDLTSPDACARAAEGAVLIYHLAAGFDKSFAGAFMNSVVATRNLFQAFVHKGQPKRFVNVSSFAVYSNLTLKRGALLDEDSPLEDAPQERYDAYGFGKQKQEQIVTYFGSEFEIPFVIMRPGTVFGPGKRDLTGRIGVDTFGFFMHIGGSNLLPLTFVDNCAEAIVLAGLVPGVDNEIFNVVDDELLTSRQFLQSYKKHVNNFFSVPIPYIVAKAFSGAWEAYSRRSRGQLPPAFNRRRCAAEWKGNRYSNRKLREKLGWKPRVGINEAMALFLNQFQSEEN